MSTLEEEREFGHLADLALLSPSALILALPRTVAVANPAPGADWSVPVPPGCVWFVQSIRAKFVTSAVVAGRVPELIITDGNDRVAFVPGTATQSASVSPDMSWISNFGTAINAVAALGQASPFPRIPIPEGFTIATVTSSIDVGDQWSQIRLYVVECRYRNRAERDEYLRNIKGGYRPDSYPGLLLGL